MNTMQDGRVMCCEKTLWHFLSATGQKALQKKTSLETGSRGKRRWWGEGGWRKRNLYTENPRCTYVHRENLVFTVHHHYTEQNGMWLRRICSELCVCVSCGYMCLNCEDAKALQAQERDLQISSRWTQRKTSSGLIRLDSLNTPTVSAMKLSTDCSWYCSCTRPN